MKAPANNFTPIRLIAAWLILFGHSFDLTRNPEPLVHLLHYNSATFIALSAFFIISGHLVTASWLNRKSTKHYAANRFLRIFPAFAVMVLLCTFVLGPLCTTLTSSEYFAHSDTWKYLRTLSIFTLRYNLPGVFETLPYPDVVNGSLWSLKLEVKFYIALAIIGIIGLLKPRLMIVLALGSLAFNAYLNTQFPEPPKYLYGIKFTDLHHYSLWGFFFWAGGCATLYSERLRFTRKLLGAAAALGLIFFSLKPYGVYLHHICWVYVILYLAYGLKPLTGWLQRNDLSYGVYLYSFPVQQATLLLMGNAWGISGFILIATLATLLMAYLSWRLIEAPCLRLKKS